MESTLHVTFSLPGGVFLPCDQEVDFYISLCENSINQINQIYLQLLVNSMLPSSCVTPAGTSIEVQNEWEENTHTHSCHGPLRNNRSGLRRHRMALCNDYVAKECWWLRTAPLINPGVICPKGGAVDSKLSEHSRWTRTYDVTELLYRTGT